MTSEIDIESKEAIACMDKIKPYTKTPRNVYYTYVLIKQKSRILARIHRNTLCRHRAILRAAGLL